MGRMKKENCTGRVILLASILMLMVLFVLAPSTVMAEDSVSVEYIRRSWDGSKVVSVTETRTDAKPVPADGNMTKGWYYLDKDVTKNGRIESITGDVNLILGDGYTLDVKGLYVPSAWKLTIYGQSEGTGKIYSHPSGGAGIGGYKNHDNGNIVIQGGTIEAKGYDHCAGIGSNDDCRGGYINIFGGTIKATGGNDGAGIGGGEDCDSGDINIYGGDLNVTAGNNAAGIGGGENGDGDYINIYGGNIEVTSSDGAAIGGAEDGDGGQTKISGGTLKLNSGNGAGIGGGNKAGDGGHITITGGNITIHSEHGAGIGGGRGPTGFTEKNSGDGGTIRISGDTTKIDITTNEGYCIGAGGAATGRGYGSGNSIGSGGNVRIDGGELTLKGKSGGVNTTCIGGDTGHFEMYGGTIYGDKSLEDSNHLFWYIGNAEVEIYGGYLSGYTVRMKDDEEYDGNKMQPCSIFKMTGGELHIYNPYTQRNGVEANRITLSDTVMVKQGKNEDEQKPVPAADRVKTANGLTNYYVTIKDCDHPDAKYSVHSATSHSPLCSYCSKHILDEPHVYDGVTNICIRCGYETHSLNVTIDPDNGDTPLVVSVPRQGKVSEPEVPAKRGFVFQGWYRVFSPLVEELYDFDTPVTEDIKLKARWQNQWSELQELIQDTKDGETLVLENDYTAGTDDTALEIPVGRTITIDLNGHVIDRANPSTKGVASSSAIKVNGDATNLTIEDSEGSGMITGGACGGIIVNGGTFTLSGGSIRGNTNEDYGGGVVVTNYGTFNMTGGSISGNSSDGVEGEYGGDGGGVSLASRTTFNMSGGSIRVNTCTGHGGGVYMNGRSTFNMTGGSIEYNVGDTYGGGVCMDGYGTFNLSGDSTITGNKVLVNKATLEAGDVYLPNTNKKINITGELAETARIGISVKDASYTGESRPFTSGLSGKGAAENFISNNDQYIVQKNNGQEAYLYIPPDTVNVTFDKNDGTDDEELIQTVEIGEKATRPADPVREDYSFLGWYQVIKAEPETLAEEEFDFDTPVMEDITLKALWGKEEPDWSAPVYVWTEDNSKVTASRTNNNEPFNTEEETVGTTIGSKTDPTCEEAGETVYNAEFTNPAFEAQTKTVVFDALGHDWSEWEEKEAGVEQRTCSRCDRTETRQIPPTDHVHYVKIVEKKEATCEETGNIEYYICSEGDDPCGRYFVKDEKGDITINFEGKEYSAKEINLEDTITPVTDHKWDEGVVTQEPGCVSYGTRTFTCTICGEEKEEKIDWEGHKNKWHDEAKVPATCVHSGYHWEIYQCDICGEIMTQRFVSDKALGHNWSSWKVIKKATVDEEGEKSRTCSRCGEVEYSVIPQVKPTPTPAPDDGMGEDGTAVGPGASYETADKVITSMTKDTDPKGSVFAKLRLKSTKQTKSSIKLNWTKVSKAKRYVIYGNRCGKNIKPKKLAVSTGKSKTFKKVAGKKVKKGTYYKFIIVAIDKNNKVVSTSKLVHAATKGGKVGNHKKVTVKKSILTKAKKLKKGKSLSLKAKAVAQSKKLKVRIHVKVRYESTNTKIATVTKKGVIKARKKGTCYVYAFAQNGVYKKVKVVVK